MDRGHPTIAGDYSIRERFWLGVLAAVGLFGLNGVFVYALLFEEGAIGVALTNPISAAFIAEALVLVGVLAYLLGKWRVARISWWWFVVLSLVGGILFALPVVILWRTGANRSPA